jgi:site-specific recombinase XerD
MSEVALSATRRIPERRFLTAAHRFRKTFAVELLLAGVPIHRVSELLGYQSVRITEKYYAP